MGWLPWYALLVLSALLPWALGLAAGANRWTCARRAYARKWLSDLLVAFAGIWILALTGRAVMVVDQAGAAALAIYLPLLWIPMGMLIGAR